MKLHGIIQRLRNSTPMRALRDTRGAAAIEMGIITPAILSLVLGTAELATGVAVDRKVTLTARALSDLVAQSKSISDSDIANVFSAAGSIMTPYSTSPLKARVTAVNINASLNATVAWSNAQNMTARSTGAAVTIPNGLKIANTQLIWAEVRYEFTPPVVKFLTGTVTLKDEFFARPRETTTICRPPIVTSCS
jgi:Flp pilus assembly protein TadG